MPSRPPPEYTMVPNPQHEGQRTGNPFVYQKVIRRGRNNPPTIESSWIRVRVDGRASYMVVLKDKEKPEAALQRFIREKEAHYEQDPRKGLRPGQHPHRHLFDSDSMQSPKYPDEPHMQEILYGPKQREQPESGSLPDSGDNGKGKVGRPRKSG